MPVKWIVMGLVLSYPLTVHLAVLSGNAWLQLLALFNLLLAVSLPGLIKRSPLSWLMFVGISAALGFVFWIGGGTYALFVPSLLIPGLLFWVFASTLRAGQVPLISRIAEVQSGAALPPPVSRYTRRLTQMWAALFALMIGNSLMLIALDQIPLWSVMTNFVHYLVAAAFFVLEYPYRCWRFPERRQPSFVAYLRKSATMDLRSQ